MRTMGHQADDESHTIYVVDDDKGMRDLLTRCLADLEAELVAFSRPSEILAVAPPSTASCLLVDYRLPEMDGLTLLGTLRSNGWSMPFLVVTGYGEVPLAVSAMHLGAVDFLEKPFDESVLRKQVSHALAEDAMRIRTSADTARLLEKLNKLTARERQVLQLVVDGKLNKQIAANLGVSLKTIETHRANLMRKLEPGSLARLVRMVIESGYFDDMSK